MKNNILSLILIFTISISFAQKLNYKELDGKQLGEYDNVMLGKQNNLLATYLTDYISILKVTVKDANFKKIDSYIGANFKDISINKKGIFIFNETADEFNVEQIDNKGNSIQKVKLMNKPKIKQFKVGDQKFYRHKIIFSEDLSCFAVCQGVNDGILQRKNAQNTSSFDRYLYDHGFSVEKVQIFDFDLKLVSKYDFDPKNPIEFSTCFLSNQGQFYGLEFGTNSNVVKIENNLATKVPFKLNETGFVKLFIKAIEDKVIVTSIVSTFGHDPGNNSLTRLAAQKINYQFLNAKDLSKIYEQNYQFTQDEIQKSLTKSEARDEHKSQGISGLRLSDLKLINGNEIIATYYQDMEWNGVTVLSFSNIYINKVTSKGVEKSIVLDRIDDKMDWFNVRSYKPISIVQNNKLYVYYLKNNLEEFGFKEFDMNFKETKSNFENYSKAKKSMPYPQFFERINDKRYVMSAKDGEYIIEF